MYDGPEDARTIVLAHGAGAAMAAGVAITVSSGEEESVRLIGRRFQQSERFDKRS